ncbi:MAG TPA: S49 family peptidase [Sphingobium sp.]|uniref:S49 family peptidase n=1 Tax=Sphingobium sp. TaxID=1912891 RepID=UPI002ED63C09
MIQFPLQAAQGLFNSAIALLPSSTGHALQLLAQSVQSSRGSATRTAFGVEGDAQNGVKPYDVVAGVAIIPVKGILIQRLDWLWEYGELFGVTGYDRLRYQFMHALADPTVEAIAFDIDSPGGEVAGCFDLVDTIYRARGIKPLAAILGENAYSAAFAIASAVDPRRLWVPRTGGTGSVGVIYIHLSVAEWLRTAGITPTLITKGDFKGETSDMLKLSKDALARLQTDVDDVGQLFIDTVARNRGLSTKLVEQTQAATFQGVRGVEAGFASAVASPDAAFQALLKQLG